MRSRCVCTRQNGQPDPTCALCKGKGEIIFSFPESETIECVWFERCPACGLSNGTYIQIRSNPPPATDKWSTCVVCESRPKTEWIMDSNVANWWHAVCPTCSESYFLPFLQRTTDPAPTSLLFCPACQIQMRWEIVI